MKRFLTALSLAFIIAITATAADARPRGKPFRSHAAVVVQEEPSFFNGFGGGSAVVDRARQYIGATASQVGVRSTLWCSAFVRKITGASGVDDRAVSWEGKPRVSPQVGAIVTMGRRGGGHVGVVSGFAANGDPIVISGNNRGRVREAVYPRQRIRAWVSAS